MCGRGTETLQWICCSVSTVASARAEDARLLPALQARRAAPGRWAPTVRPPAPAACPRRAWRPPGQAALGAQALHPHAPTCVLEVPWALRRALRPVALLP